MKKLMSAIVASVISVSTLVPVFAADTFKDVNSKSYSKCRYCSAGEAGICRRFE